LRLEAGDPAHLALADAIALGQAAQRCGEARRKGPASARLVDDDGTFVGQYAMHLVTTPDDFARAAIEHLEPLMLTACIHAVRNAGCLDMITRLIDESANVVEPLPGGGDSAKPGQGVG